MVDFSLDYFKCRPSELHFRLLCFAGYWPLETKRKTFQILYSVYSYFCCLSIISMSFIQVLDLYILRNDEINLVKNLCASSITFALVAKYVLLFYKIEKVRKLHNELNAFADGVKDPEDVEILEKGEKQISWMTRCFFGLAVPCVIVWMLYPGLESSHERRVPFPYRLPTDFKKSPYYEIVYTYQSMSMIGFLLNTLPTDLIFCSFIVRINCRVKIMAKNVRAWLIQDKENDLAEGNDDNTSIVKPDSIRETISTHQKVLQQISQLHYIYRHMHLIHFIGVITQVGAIVLEVVVITKGFKLQVIQRMFYGMCGLASTFFLCYFGTSLEEECKKVGIAVYETDWHEMSPKIRKYVLMLMIKSQKPAILKVSSFFPLNLPTFLEFLKLTYNITGFLYHSIRT